MSVPALRCPSKVAFALCVCLPAYGCKDERTNQADTDGSASTGQTDTDAVTGTFPSIGPLVGTLGESSFRFGVASAATQIEDQNPSVDWYVWTAPSPEGLGNGTFVGEASRGYSLALADLDLLTELGVDSYRFSIEWARVEPARDQIDEEALQHYGEFIDGLLERGIRPMITVHHFSNPIWVDDPRDPDCAAGPTDANLCGWNHPQGGPMVAQELGEHARLLAERYGDRVDEWVTLNEPINYLLAAYGVGQFPPGKDGILGDIDGVLVAAARNFLEGHVAAYRAIDAADVTDADGDDVAAAIGLTKGAIEFVPARDNAVSDHPDDLAARERIDYVYHALFIEALQQGAFDAEFDGELEEPHPQWADSLDWIGLQYYLRAGVTADPGLLPLVAVTPCFGGFDFGSCVPPRDPTYHVPAMEYEHDPAALYDRLVDFSTRWPALPIVVTESGIATEVGERRAEVVVRALEQIERAREEGIDVRGYYHWSIYDNFEWAEGYGPRFGLYRVDYDTFERSPTLGATVYQQIVSERDIPAMLRDSYGGDGPLTPE